MTLSLAALSGTGFTPCAFASFRRDWTTATRSFGMGMGNGDCVLKKLGRSALHSNSRTTKLEPKQLNPTRSGDRGGGSSIPLSSSSSAYVFQAVGGSFHAVDDIFQPCSETGLESSVPLRFGSWPTFLEPAEHSFEPCFETGFKSSVPLRFGSLAYIF